MNFQKEFKSCYYGRLMKENPDLPLGIFWAEASQSLGSGRMVTLPMARPWIFGGLILIFMETLADFGAVSVFNYDTFTTGIYKAWYGLFSVNAAAQLASILVVIVLVIFAAESWCWWKSSRRCRSPWCRPA